MLYSKVAIFHFKRDFVIQVRWIEQWQLSHHLLAQPGADHCANVNTRPVLVEFYRVALPGERWALNCGTAWNVLGYHMKPPWAVQKEDQVPFLSPASIKGLWFEVIGLMATDQPFETRKPFQRRQRISLNVIVGLVVQRLTCLLGHLEKLVDAFSRIPSSDIAQTWEDQLGFFYGELEMIV